MSFTRHEVEDHEPERMVEGIRRRKKPYIPTGTGSALSKATSIQNKYPKRILCGSLALILYEAIPNRKIRDLDFVTYEQNVKDDEFVSLKCSAPFKHCLFLSSSVEKGEMIHGLRLQNLDQIIYWKKKFGRERDMKDLENYKDSQYFSEEEFIIDI